MQFKVNNLIRISSLLLTGIRTTTADREFLRNLVKNKLKILTNFDFLQIANV